MYRVCEHMRDLPRVEVDHDIDSASLEHLELHTGYLTGEVAVCVSVCVCACACACEWMGECTWLHVCVCVRGWLWCVWM